MVDFFLQKIDDKTFEISGVRKELERNKIDEEEIRIIVKLVDEELQRRLLASSSHKRSQEIVYAGAALTLVGVLITLGTYTGVIEMGHSFLVVYGPFLGGLSMMVVGLARGRDKSKGPLRESNRFQRKGSRIRRR